MKENIVEYYRALANPVRLEVFLYIVKKSDGSALKNPKKESCVTEIAKALDLPQPTVSNHLKVLKQAGLVKSASIDTHCYQYVTKDATQVLLKHTQYLFEQAHKNPY